LGRSKWSICWESLCGSSLWEDMSIYCASMSRAVGVHGIKDGVSAMQYSYYVAICAALVLGFISWLITNHQGDALYPVKTSLGPHLSQFTAMSAIALCLQSDRNQLSPWLIIGVVLMLLLQVAVMKTQTKRTRGRVKELLQDLGVNQNPWLELGEDIIDVDFSPRAKNDADKSERRKLYLRMLRDYADVAESKLVDSDGEWNQDLLLVDQRKLSWALYVITTVIMVVFSAVVAYFLGVTSAP